MAIVIKKYKGTPVDLNQEFVCDYASDIASLPTQTTTPDCCPTGSTAFVIEDSSEWMLGSDGVWKSITKGSGTQITVNTGGGIVVDTVADRDALISENIAYEGIVVYVKADSTLYVLKGTTSSDWETVGSDAEMDLSDLQSEVSEIDTRVTTVETKLSEIDAVETATDSEVSEMIADVFENGNADSEASETLE